VRGGDKHGLIRRETLTHLTCKLLISLRSSPHHMIRLIGDLSHAFHFLSGAPIAQRDELAVTVILQFNGRSAGVTQSKRER
jgi:hypothetical protein